MKSVASAAIFVVVGACSHARTGELTTSQSQADGGPTTAAADAAPVDAPSVFANAKPPEPLPEEAPTCEDTKNVFLFTSPNIPSANVPLRVMAVSDKPLAGKLEITTAEGTSTSLAASDARHGGPPYFWTAEIEAPKAGKLDASLVQKACEAGRNVATKRITVGTFRPGPPAAPKEDGGLWPVHRNWNRNLENVYSAWIEQLFDAPDGEMPSWPALHEVLRDKKRNFLFDHLSAGEDSNNAFTARPDCADLPYFLRAYFAFKLRLPFGLSECDRGGGGNAPSCRKTIITNDDPPARFDEKATAVKAFGTFLRGTVADKAHSGSARQPFEEENSDYYPVALTSEALRPGTIYADPYGHVLMIAKRLPQTADHGGVLLAVDGQPDGTVARKRYWRGNFLYATQRELGGPGFKRFRPVARRDGKLARPSDAAIMRNSEYGDVSREAQKLDVEGFYDAMDDALSPRPLDPQKAMMETIAALEEQVKTRVKSVDNGRKWLETAKGPASMPDGPEIFETSGVWEDFSTPSRDLRLLIAIDVVHGFPARVARRPERYAMPPGATPKQVEAELEKILKKELESRSVVYQRTDGSSFTLTLAQVLARGPALETAYNPNDCVESRWGAPAGSPELATCRGQAPSDQKAKMESYRAWFHDRRRPARK